LATLLTVIFFVSMWWWLFMAACEAGLFPSLKTPSKPAANTLWTPIVKYCALCVACFFGFLLMKTW
jgi:hypothetical protein